MTGLAVTFSARGIERSPPNSHLSLNWCRRIPSQTPVNSRSSRQNHGFREVIRV
ncbi:hypothetical protein [Arthrospira sp. PCC 8006]|uniref:hypothetical protein n=1 Tax=Arthrospira sp. PCC 8006 TaxID=1982224 RepID=UPI00396F6C3C